MNTGSKPEGARRGLRCVSVALALALAFVPSALAGAAGPEAGVPPSPLLDAKRNAVVQALTDRREVALTFDDGPDPRWTPRFLRLLERHDARATFFLIGWRAMRYPDIVREQLAGGHEIGNHTFHHPRLPTLPAPAIEAEIVAGSDALVQSGAPRPTLFRPPYGDSDRRVGAAALGADEVMVDWGRAIDPPLRERGPAYAARVVLRRIGPGSIILAHDGSLHPHRSLRATRLVLRGLDRKGLRVAPAGVVLGLGDVSPP